MKGRIIAGLAAVLLASFCEAPRRLVRGTYWEINPSSCPGLRVNYPIPESGLEHEFGEKKYTLLRADTIEVRREQVLVETVENNEGKVEKIIRGCIDVESTYGVLNLRQPRTLIALNDIIRAEGFEGDILIYTWPRYRNIENHITPR